MLVELVILAVLIVMLRKYLFKSRAEKLYEKIPGPKPYPIVGNLFYFNHAKEDPIITLKNFSKQYGPVYYMRMCSENVVCIRNTSDVEVVLSNNAMVNKPDGNKVLFPVVNQGLFTSSGEEWRKQRRFLTPAFHVSVLQSFISYFEKSAILLVKNLSEMVGKEFDVTKLMSLCSFDIICDRPAAVSSHGRRSTGSDVIRSGSKNTAASREKRLTPHHQAPTLRLQACSRRAQPSLQSLGTGPAQL
ncbi:heme binding [Homalodisca vitripennis]|nr:heme binding [Homalodisca vitripennis]